MARNQSYTQQVNAMLRALRANGFKMRRIQPECISAFEFTVKGTSAQAFLKAQEEAGWTHQKGSEKPKVRRDLMKVVSLNYWIEAKQDAYAGKELQGRTEAWVQVQDNGEGYIEFSLDF